jgi:hypothetical protein
VEHRRNFTFVAFTDRQQRIEQLLTFCFNDAMKYLGDSVHGATSWKVVAAIPDNPSVQLT